MKIYTKELKKAIREAQAVVMQSEEPLLECVRIKAEEGHVSVSALNISTETKRTISIVDGDEEFDFAVNAELVSKLISCFNNEVTTLKVEKTAVIFENGFLKSTLSTLSPKDWVSIEKVETDNSWRVKSATLRKAVYGVFHATAAKNVNNEMFRSIHLYLDDDGVDIGVTASGTDSFRFARREYSNGNTPVRAANFLIEASVLKYIVDTLVDEDTDIYYNDNYICFKDSGGEITVQTKNHSFYDLSPLLAAKEGTNVVFNKEELIEALRPAFVVASTTNAKMIATSMKMGPFGTSIFTKGEIAEYNAEIKSATRATELQISFNAKSMLEALQSIDDENVTMWSVGINKNESGCPLLIKGRDFAEAIMPVLKK